MVVVVVVVKIDVYDMNKAVDDNAIAVDIDVGVNDVTQGRRHQ